MLLPAAVDTALILSLLRSNLTSNNLEAYIIPYGGSHYDESLAACDSRIAFVSNFKGSAGSVIISGTKALLWTDGRYWLEAEATLYPNWELMKQGESGVPSQAEWLRTNVPHDTGRVGVAGSTYPKSQFDSMKQSLNEVGITLVNMDENLVDKVWTDFPGDPRPDCPTGPLLDLPLSFSGKPVLEKLGDVRKLMSDEGADLLLVSELDEVAWLLNMRGTDMSASFFGFIILTPTRFEVFVDPIKVPEPIQAKFIEYGVLRYRYDEVTTRLRDQAQLATKVWLSRFVNAKLADSVPVGKQMLKRSAVILMKALKNSVEAEGMRNAHLRDSAAIVGFQAWLEARLNSGDTTITEISAAEHLYQIRTNGDHFIGESFNTIAGFGSNGAIIHYRATPETNKNVTKDSLFLVDSGGQYRDGTCDITRTMHFGTPTAEQKDRYTRVLKGHIGIASAVLPNKTPGRILDSYARRYLWDIGLEYKHGTGHGIGHYLNVHEGPHSIGGYSVDDSGLEENMFVSNEPGYYKDGEYGIRIENIVRIAKSVAHTGFLEIETVSLVPLSKNLIDVDLLTDEELAWVNQYHALCLEKVGKYIDDHPSYLGPEVKEYLVRETEPIVKDSGTTEAVSTTEDASITETVSTTEADNGSGAAKVSFSVNSIAVVVFSVILCALK